MAGATWWNAAAAAAAAESAAPTAVLRRQSRLWRAARATASAVWVHWLLTEQNAQD